VDADAKIADLYFSNSASGIDYQSYHTQPNGSGQLSDSDDSYAATFLSLVASYRKVTCDDAWVRANIGKLKDIATKNLVRSQWSNGLVHVFQDVNAYPGAYLEDNAEAYQGLSDFAKMLTALGDSSAIEYSMAARRIAQGIQDKMFFDPWPTECVNPPGFAVLWSSADMNAKGVCLSKALGMYPEGITQVFPQVFGVPLPASQYAAGWGFLNSRFPNFDVAINGLPPYPVHDDPWTILGYAAALDGRNDVALRMLALTETVYKTNPSLVHLNDWGFYQRTRRVLGL
jgi:hypothetical protein